MQILIFTPIETIKFRDSNTGVDFCAFLFFVFCFIFLYFPGPLSQIFAVLSIYVSVSQKQKKHEVKITISHKKWKGRKFLE